eukprot:gene11745-11891_t
MAAKLLAAVGFLLMLTVASCQYHNLGKDHGPIINGRHLASSGGKVSGGTSAGGYAGAGGYAQGGVVVTGVGSRQYSGASTGGRHGSGFESASENSGFSLAAGKHHVSSGAEAGGYTSAHLSNGH